MEVIYLTQLPVSYFELRLHQMCTILYAINYMYMLCLSWCSGWVFLSGVNFGPTPETAVFSKTWKTVRIGVYESVSAKQVGLHVRVVIYISEVLYYNRSWLSAKILQAISCEGICVRA